jgi:hypothetical protein
MPLVLRQAFPTADAITIVTKNQTAIIGEKSAVSLQYSGLPQNDVTPLFVLQEHISVNTRQPDMHRQLASNYRVPDIFFRQKPAIRQLKKRKKVPFRKRHIASRGEFMIAIVLGLEYLYEK